MKRPEQKLQQAVYKYIRYAAPHVLCFHPQNNIASRNSAKLGGIYKSMGVMPGVADLLLFWNKSLNTQVILRDAGEFAAIELKAGKGTQTDHQKAFMHKWTELGGHYAICRSIDEVESVLKEWKALV